MKSRANYLTVSQNCALETACAALNDAGCEVYMVGSCLTRADFRDVDLRCILDDDEFRVMFDGRRVRLRLFNAALSDWLSARTGLPVDFQFQSQIVAASHDGPRNAMGILLECERAQDRSDPREGEEA